MSAIKCKGCGAVGESSLATIYCKGCYQRSYNKAIDDALKVLTSYYGQGNESIGEAYFLIKQLKEKK